MQPIETGQAVVLHGDAMSRGAQQAMREPAQIAAVRSAVRGRLASLADELRQSAVVRYLAAQWEFVRDHDAPGLAETQGIAEGFGLRADEVFAYLHLNIVADLADPSRVPRPEADGCTAWAWQRSGAAGTWVAKNRDYRGEHGALQRVFLHRDPAWGARTVLCVGSLGSPGAFSSGMNSEGLAVVDTQIPTHDHGTGWLRYFLMSWLLRSCTTVRDAVHALMAMPHAGGGSLVLGDAGGAVAAVELGHARCAAEGPGPRWSARTNHFVDAAMVPAMRIVAPDDLSSSSQGRRERICRALQSGLPETGLEAIRTLMAAHDGDGEAGLCRHADHDGTRTLSTSIYDTRIRSLTISDGAPCSGRWRCYTVSGGSG